MKNLLIFLFGAGVGACGTFLWFRKDIKKQLEETKNNAKNEQSAEENVPFSVDEDDKNKPEAIRNATKIVYNKIIADVKNGVKPPSAIPILPREEEEDLINKSEFEGQFVEDDETSGGIFEIDRDEFNENKTFEKDQLVYFRGDRIMATEEGTIIENPFMMVGGEWENCVGNYAKRTAFIRNSRLVTDYEIYVEDGLYSDEYGLDSNYKED